jgi:hypothetical protein
MRLIQPPVLKEPPLIGTTMPSLEDCRRCKAAVMHDDAKLERIQVLLEDQAQRAYLERQ